MILNNKVIVRFLIVWILYVSQYVLFVKKDIYQLIIFVFLHAEIVILQKVTYLIAQIKYVLVVFAINVKTDIKQIVVLNVLKDI